MKTPANDNGDFDPFHRGFTIAQQLGHLADHERLRALLSTDYGTPENNR